VARGGVVVEPNDRQLRRDRDTELGCGFQRAEGKGVGHGENPCGRLRLPQQLQGGLPCGLGGVRPARADERRVPRRAETLLVAGESLDAQVQLQCTLGIECGDERQDRDPLVAQLAEKLGGGARGGAIVDPDERRGRTSRLVDGDDREFPGERGLDARIVLGRGVDDEPIDRCLSHGASRFFAIARVRDQEEARRRLPHRACDSAEERGLGGIGEGIAKPFREDEPDRTGPPGAEPSCGRIRSGVAELLGRVQHPLPDLVRHELRPAERLRGAPHRDPRLLGDVPQADSPSFAAPHDREYYAGMNRFR